MSYLEKLHPLFRTPGEIEPNAAYFIARLGEEGEEWAVEYTRPEHVEIMQRLTRALELLRARRIAAGHRELQIAEQGYREAEGASPDVYPVLGRWYFGALAYYHYCAEDYQAASEALDLADKGIHQAIERRRFLLPFAEECFDLSWQRVRVARNQRRWDEVWRRLDISREIARGERPYCALSDGTEIRLADLQAFYEALEPLTESERRPLRLILDPETRERRVQRLLGEIYVLPGFVIPYTPTPAAS